MTTSKRSKLFLLYVVALGVTFALFTLLVIAEAYVRWTLNQSFSFLGGTGLLSLAVLLFGQFSGLAYLIKGDS